MPNRIKFVFFIYLSAFFVLSARLFYWQIVKGSELSQKAKNQYLSGGSDLAPRGEILASDGSWLAATVESYLVYANPKQISLKPEILAKQLASIFVENKNSEEDNTVLLDNEEDKLKKLLSKTSQSWVVLNQKVSPEIKNKIEDLELEGVGFEQKTSRFLPEASSAAHLLGFVGKDDKGADKGYFGLEGYYDITLTGKSGYVSGESDLLGNPIFIDEKRESRAITGISLETTIDKVIQNSVHKKLAEGITKYGAEGGSVIIMNPSDGSILAMESIPSFDPNSYWEFGNDYFINPAVSLSYEPGSIFKIIVMAVGIDAGVITPTTECDKCSGPLRIGSYSIRTWDDKYYPNTTMSDVIVHSDNVGMAFISGRLGKDRLYDYLEKFGFGQKSGVDLQGELASQLRKKETWKEIDTATVSFGQGIAVTSIQMIRAAAAIANNGLLPKPHVVKNLIGEDWKEQVGSNDQIRVISQKAASDVTQMMVEAANKGEAKWTNRSGYGVAGKTGTAQIPIEGHYDESNTIASFVGFAPYNSPKFIMLVTLKKPQSSHWASETAAPLWYSIADDLFDYFDIQPKN